MADQAAKPSFSCFTVSLNLAVGAAVAAALIGGLWGPRVRPWSVVGSGAIAAVGVFLVARQLLSLFWGLAAVLLLALHPSIRGPVDQPGLGTLAEGGVVAVLAVAGIVCQLAFQPVVYWKLWPPVALLLAGGIGLTWAGQAQAGLLAAFLAIGTILPAGWLAGRYRQRNPAAAPNRLNIYLACILAVGAPAIAIYSLRYVNLTDDLRAWDLFRQTLQSFFEEQADGFTFDRLRTWCWPTLWAVLPILAWGWWRTIRRGWKQWSNAQVPAAWFLGLTTLLLAISAAPRPAGNRLLLTSATVLLAVFLLADLAKGSAERLMLPPPGYDEEYREPVEEKKAEDAQPGASPDSGRPV